MGASSALRLSRWLPPGERERIAAYGLRDAGLGADVFGARRETIATGYAIGYWLHEYYFRVQSSGHASIPATGAAVVVGNHGGVLPWDAMMVVTDVFRRSAHPRLVRYMVEHFVPGLPFVGQWFRELGQVSGTRRNFDGLAEDGHLIGVFPEGAPALMRPPAATVELDPFSPGHVELAARHQIPIVPFGIAGPEHQYRVVADLRGIARRFGLPFLPITTRVLPKRVGYVIRYGTQIWVDPAVARRLDVRDREVERVRTAVRRLVEDARGASGGR